MAELTPDWAYDDHDEPDDEDYDLYEVECGAWFNGKFDFYHCQLAGTEDCDWECPYSASVRGLAPDPRKAKQP